MFNASNTKEAYTQPELVFTYVMSATLWGSNIGFWVWAGGFGCRIRSCCDLIFAGEPAEDCFAMDLVAG